MQRKHRLQDAPTRSVGVQNSSNKYRRNLVTEPASGTTLRDVTVSGSNTSHRRKRRAEPAQLVLWKPRGGKRRGAGRKPNGRRAGSPQQTPAEHNAREHVA